MLRVGNEGIVSFPNFGYWRVRKMPVSKRLPYEWHNTPNIRLCTVDDFEKFCSEKSINIIERRVLDNNYNSGFAQKLLPNLFGMFGSIAVYRISKQT